MANFSGGHTTYPLLIRCKFPPGIIPTATSPGRRVTIVRQGHQPAGRGWYPYLVTVPMTRDEIQAQQLPTDLSLSINGQVSRVLLLWK